MIADLWEYDRQVEQLLRQSRELEEARAALFDYLKEIEWNYRQGEVRVHELEWTTAMQALRVLGNLISRRSEKIAGFSTLEVLWQIAREGNLPQQIAREDSLPQQIAREDSLPQQIAREGPDCADSLSSGFLEEFRHLFKAIHGRSGIAAGWLNPMLAREGVEPIALEDIVGPAGGLARSNFLDRMGEKAAALVQRYPNGLSPELVEQREGNRQRILDFFGATLDDWYHYRWQLQHVLHGRRGWEQLQELVPLSKEERQSIRLCVQHKVPFGITPYYLSLFDFEPNGRRQDDQLRAQVIPPLYYVEQMIAHRLDRERCFDFMDESSTSPIPLVTRRYASIVVIKPFNTCPQICAYCQRNWEIAGPMEAGAMPSWEQLDRALDWIADHPTVQDILITGGDPLFMSDRAIQRLMDRVGAMEHVVHVRWATRAPVTVPMRLTPSLTRMLARYIDPGRRTFCLVTHIESASEVTPDLVAAIARVRGERISVYNQQVFTRYASRRFQAVLARIAMKQAGVDPYYLFYPKPKEEMRDYLVPVARLAQERKEEARLLPGLFRTDEPVFNVPRLGKDNIQAGQDRELIAIRPDGRRVYLWHPWEKGIAPMEPWPSTDCSIHEYLQWLESVGENPQDYESIWYYY